MKLRYLFISIWLCCGIASASAQTISFPDENFKNALIGSGFDTNKDGEIQKSEVAGIKSLSVDRANITSLVGIKNFTSLEELGFNDNKLKTVDLEGMQHLRIIHGFNNELTQVKLKGCTALQTLALYNNQLSFIDLTGLAELTRILITSNNLRSIDLSHKPKLERVLLFRNQLTDFKADDSPNLQVLMLSYNQIEEIDLRHFSKLVEVELVNNPLRKINVTGLSLLETLNCESIMRTSYLTQLNTCGLISLKECKW